jgi:hypothetical protein
VLDSARGLPGSSGVPELQAQPAAEISRPPDLCDLG